MAGLEESHFYDLLPDRQTINSNKYYSHLQQIKMSINKMGICTELLKTALDKVFFGKQKHLLQLNRSFHKTTVNAIYTFRHLFLSKTEHFIMFK